MSVQSPQRLRNSQQPLGASTADATGRSDGSPERPRFTRTNSTPFNSTTARSGVLDATHNDRGAPLSERPQAIHSQSYSIHPPMLYQQNPQQYEQSQPMNYSHPTSQIPPQYLPSTSNASTVLTQEPFEMTAELLAEIERADREQYLQQQRQQRHYTPPEPGTVGLAYAGGIVSSGSSSAMSSAVSLSVGGPGERGSPRDVEPPPNAVHGLGSVARRQVHRRSRSRTPELQMQMQHSPQSQTFSHAEIQSRTRASPLYQALTTSQAQAQAQVQAQVQGQSQVPAMSRGSPTIRSVVTEQVKTRTPDRDRSLPVQEEPEEDHEKDVQRERVLVLGGQGEGVGEERGGSKRTPPLVDLEEGSKQHQRRESGEDTTSGDGAHTPRSPSYLPPIQTGSLQAALRTEPGGFEAFDPGAVELAVRKLQGQGGSSGQFSSLQQQQQQQQQPLSSIQQRLQEQEVYGRIDNLMGDTNNTRQMMMSPPQHELRPESVDPFFDAQAYLQHYLYTPQGTPAPQTGSAISSSSLQQPRERPDAPIPPTPHSQTAAPSPITFPNQLRSLLPIQSPAPPGGTPFPYPFHHVRRGYSGVNDTNSPFPSQQGTLYDENANANASMHPPQYDYGNLNLYDPVLVQRQLALQMQMYALNNGAMTDSTFSAFSPAATPFPGATAFSHAQYNPFQAFLEQSQHRAARHFMAGERDAERAAGALGNASVRSSPSHMPVELPPKPFARGRGLKKRDTVTHLRSRAGEIGSGAVVGVVAGGIGTGAGRVGVRGARPKPAPPPRVESTQPRETSPEPSTSGEETAGEGFEGMFENVGGGEWLNRAGAGPGAGTGTGTGTGTTTVSVGDESEWVDEEMDEEDLLDLEFHTEYVLSVARRRKRWEQKWGELVRAFQALDRQTDATLFLMASPSHTNSLHSVSSRSLRRDPSLLHSPAMSTMKSSFAQLATQRRAARSKSLSLLDRLSLSLSAAGSMSSSAGSPTSLSASQAGDAREEDLRRALGAALGSLSELGRIYEEREGRWRDEMMRLGQERESVEVLLRQALGSHVGGAGIPPGGGVQGLGAGIPGLGNTAGRSG